MRVHVGDADGERTIPDIAIATQVSSMTTDETVTPKLLARMVMAARLEGTAACAFAGSSVGRSRRR